MLLYELKKRTGNSFSLSYDKETDKWLYKDDNFECCQDTPEDAAATALLALLQKENNDR